MSNPKPYGHTSVNISRSKGKIVTSRTYSNETGFSMTETDVKRYNRASIFDILGAFTSSIAIILLIVVCFCYMFNVNFNLDNVVQSLSNDNWDTFDWQSMTSALNSLRIDTSSWGDIQALGDFLNALLGVFKGFGYIVLSIIYVFGFALHFVSVVFGF